MHAVRRPVPAEVLDRRVQGHGIADGTTFGSLVDGDEPVLVVFLRHYG